jgi:putative nucleotidyltransferase with HDIG domain
MKNGARSRADSRPLTRIQRGLEERSSLWGRLLGTPLLWAVVAVAACSLLLMPRVGRHLPEWESGEVATQDVVLPYDLTLPDEAATEALREEARAAVLPVYDFEPRLQLELAEGIGQLFSACRAGAGSDELATASGLVVPEPMRTVLADSECGPQLESALVDLTLQVGRNRIVDDLKALERRGTQGVVLRNLETNAEQPVSLSEVSGAIDARAGLEDELRTRLLEQDAVARRWIKPTIDFLGANLEPNLVFSRAETARRVRNAGELVSTVSRVFRRGQVLIRRGDTVTHAVGLTLRQINDERGHITKYSTLAGITLLMALMVAGWGRILRRFGGVSGWPRELSMIYLLMVLFVALNRLAVFVATSMAANSVAIWWSADAYLWGLPYAAGPITIFALLGMQPAVLFAVFTALTAGILLRGDFEVVVFALAAGLVGALALQRLSDRGRLSRVGIAVGACNVVVGGVLALYRGVPEMPETMALSAAAAFIGGPLAVVVASSLLPVFEWLFGVTTDMRLLELSNQNLSLLKQLSLEAPGTYQHSLAVSNLAEAGADVVGANALLLRVCSYYHDVGKVHKPEYFVENQRGANPHDTLSPSMSSLVIQSHVKEGLEIAVREKLPLPIRQAIATHHGTKLIRYFYQKAKEHADPDLGEVREIDYRYPGPKPHTKELGILLLADAVEAAARTLEVPSPGKIQSMIDKIFTDALEDGQLDDCALTFSELDKIASAFLWVLTNMYHHRIDYPGFEFDRRQRKRDTGPLQVGSKTVAAGG